MLLSLVNKKSKPIKNNFHFLEVVFFGENIELKLTYVYALSAIALTAFLPEKIQYPACVPGTLTPYVSP